MVMRYQQKQYAKKQIGQDRNLDIVIIDAFFRINTTTAIIPKNSKERRDLYLRFSEQVEILDAYLTNRITLGHPDWLQKRNYILEQIQKAGGKTILLNNDPQRFWELYLEFFRLIDLVLASHGMLTAKIIGYKEYEAINSQKELELYDQYSDEYQNA